MASAVSWWEVCLNYYYLHPTFYLSVAHLCVGVHAWMVVVEAAFVVGVGLTAWNTEYWAQSMRAALAKARAGLGLLGGCELPWPGPWLNSGCD